MQKGDLVKHKAGTLKMVVVLVASTGVLCEWVDPTGHPHKNVFSADVLEPWVDEQVSPATEDRPVAAAPEESPGLGIIGMAKKAK